MTSIDKKLTLQVVIWSLLAGLVFSGIQMVVDYRDAQKNFDQSVNTLLERSASTAALALYNYDQRSLTAGLDAMLTHPGVVAAQVSEVNTDFMIRQGSVSGRQDLLEFTTELYVPQQYRSANALPPSVIGEVTLFADKSQVNAGFERRAIIVILADLGRTVTLIVVLLIVLRLRLTGPVRRITRRLIEADIHSPTQLNIEVEESLAGTELDDLTSKMRDLLSAMQSQMERRQAAEQKAKQLNEQLEEKVHARTRELHESNTNLQASLDQLQKMQALLLQAQRMASLGHLAAGVAHEINNPVAVVYSNIATLSEYLSELISLAEEYQQAEDKITDHELRSTLEKMRDAIDLAFVKDDGPELISASKHSLERVRNIISELRTFADSDSLAREKLSLSDLLREAVRTVDACQRDEIRLISLVDEDLEVEVVPSQMRLILGKILENACEAMPAGGNIEIASEVDDANINLVIKDSGCGMSAGELEKAINPFYSSKAVGEGTGLGLTVAYNLMLNQGGELSMASEEGHGTMVVLKFPRDNVLF